MRILVTGAAGFVGLHLPAAARRILGAEAAVVLTSRRGEGGFPALDLTDPGALRRMLGAERPSHVLNLAGIAQPAEAQKHEAAAWRLHLDAVRDLGRAMLEEVPEAVLVNAGTGLVYGGSFAAGRPVDEAALLDPRDAYGASKAAGDLALGVLARQGLRCIRMRPFNHAGPGQSEDFVIAAFAAQIARIEAGLAEPVLRVGNLEAERDFLDVRDVTDAYCLAAREARRLDPGAILNIASGAPRRIADILESLLAMSRAAIAVVEDPARMRASDLPRAVGDAGRIAELLGWRPRIAFEATLADALDDWRARVRGETPPPAH